MPPTLRHTRPTPPAQNTSIVSRSSPPFSSRSPLSRPRGRATRRCGGTANRREPASRTTALRIEAARADGLADSQTEVDVATFIQWVDATAHDDEELQEFYEQRFRPEFGVAFDAWTATDPLTTPGAPLSPFAMDDYQTSAAAETA